MKKLGQRILSITVCVMLAAVLPATPALADDEDKTEANITFTAGTGPTQPVDPDDPETPIDPESPGVGGSLVIIYTSPWDFGSVKVSSGRQRYPILTDRPNVQIADLRGTNTGWTVQVSVSPFTDAQDNPSLEGARIHIYGGRPNTNGDMDNAPSVYPQALETDGVPQNILFADSGEGMGLWVIRWYPKDSEFGAMELEVPPASVKVGAHKATVLWSFHNTP